MLGDDGVAEELLRQRVRVEGSRPARFAGGEVQFLQQLRRRAGLASGLCSASATCASCTLARHAGAAVAHGLQRLGRRTDHQVAGKDRIGLLRVDAHLVQSDRGDRPRRTNDSTEPPFCAKPMKSSTLALLPSRCAAIAITAPTVTTPVPPTPVTSRSYGPVQTWAGGRRQRGRRGTRRGRGRSPERLPSCATSRPSTPTKLGQKPFTQE